MIKQATVEDLSNMRVTKRHGRIVVTTCYYPRYLKRKLMDDYVHTLAPTRELLEEFKTRESEMSGDHDGAFEAIDYQAKFWLDESGWAELERYSTLAREQDVYFVCHCRLGQRCHRDLLLLAAKAKFGAPVGRIYLSYPVFERRLSEA